MSLSFRLGWDPWDMRPEGLDSRPAMRPGVHGSPLLGGGASSAGILSVTRGNAAISTDTGRWSEAILAAGLSWARMDRSARLGQTQIRSSGNRGKIAGNVRGAGDLPSLR